MSGDNNKIKLAVSGGTNDHMVKAEVEGDQKAITEFFSGLVPNFIHDGVGILSDSMKFWRWKNQVRLIREVNKNIDESGLSKRQIPIKVLAPIIEYSSLEEDSGLHTKWVNMLTNAATGNHDISPNYPAILNELSPLEVQILDKIFDEASKESDYSKRKAMQFDRENLRKIFSLEIEATDLIIENLFRLNLLQPPAGQGIMVGDIPFALRTTKVFEFTTLGYDFVKACRWEIIK